MSARTKARKRALDVLFASDLRGETPLEALDRVVEESGAPTNPYTAVLVRGVAEHLPRLDEVLEAYATGWSLGRMPAVDRNLLRLGAFEVLWGEDDVPGAVAVAEATSLAGELSTDESPTFVNGVLGAILRDRDLLV